MPLPYPPPVTLWNIASDLRGVLDFIVFQDDIENVTQPGQMPTKGDKIRFKVKARNYSSVPIKSISGVVYPGPAASFDPVPVECSVLSRMETKEVTATIQADIRFDTAEHWDLIATLRVTATADLSQFQFADYDEFRTRIGTVVASDDR